MIQETIVTTQNNEGVAHIAPMGVHIVEDELLIMPFKPSATLNNLLESRHAVINYTDDVRVFAGCLTGRKNWPLMPTHKIDGYYLNNALSHCEIELVHIEKDQQRPRLFCKKIHTVIHAPFQGFNRAQFAVLEAAILVSRLHMLPWEKIDTELEYLRIGLEKTAGERELEAWNWLMENIETFKNNQTPEKL